MQYTYLNDITHSSTRTYIDACTHEPLREVTCARMHTK